MKIEIRTEDVIETIGMFRGIAALDGDAALSLSTISNEGHSLDPIGAGYAVTLHAFGETAFEKSSGSFVEAMNRAIRRIHQKVKIF